MQTIAMNQMQLRQEEQRSAAAQIDTELLRMNLSLAVRRADLLSYFVPQAWTKGRNVTVLQGIELLLLLDRLLTKSRVLVHTLATHNALENYLQPRSSGAVVSHTAAMAPEMVYTLCCALLRIQQYATALDVFRHHVESANGADLIAVTNRIAEISACEGIVDDLIGLCERNELAADEPSPGLVVKGVEVLQALTRHAFSTNPGSTGAHRGVQDTDTDLSHTDAHNGNTLTVRTHTHGASKNADAMRRTLETVRAQCFAFGAALAVLGEHTDEPKEESTELSHALATAGGEGDDAHVRDLVRLDGDDEDSSGQLTRSTDAQASTFDALVRTNYAVYTFVQAQLGAMSGSRAQDGSGQLNRNVMPSPMNTDGVEVGGRDTQRGGDAHHGGSTEHFGSLEYYLNTHTQLVDTLVTVARQVGAGHAPLTQTDMRGTVQDELKRRKGFYALVQRNATRAHTDPHADTDADNDTHMHTDDSHTHAASQADTPTDMDIDDEHEDVHNQSSEHAMGDDAIAQLARVHTACEDGLKHLLQMADADTDGGREGRAHTRTTRTYTHTHTLETAHAHVPPSLLANTQVLQGEYVQLEGMRQSVATYANDVEHLQVALGEAQADLETEQTRNDMYAQKLKVWGR
ncbi:hypothetical protein SARC_13636 [Sphaeroforma arctica JP610]|uniref:Dynein associated protein domain-containing protein n=1 Tax=Sphaeroforma arctica JP610 TaxID=667725 RepID=A0A0L0FAR8_9EUKA|nr:hypothetical protein SARC_13636 [Sphaeroforma arctica JP610]KNC73807.1 hypothetical protein SARC_13636 [Sphaeroforma arctica JP610]|eukprot:XP_014147709.1 hypothetical protein SARC_13636 [Sphaeroforma arctica JP610]